MRIPSRPELSVRDLAVSVALAVLATFLVAELGAVEIIGLHSFGALISSAIVIGLLLGALSGTGVLLAVDAALLTVYLLVAFTPIVQGAAERWVRDDPAGAGLLSAVVVLSGSVKLDSALQAVAVERLVTGMELVKAGVAPRLITTRVVTHDGDRRILSDADQGRLIRLAGLEGQWTEVDSVGTTHDEATRSAALLLPVGARHIAVVTSPLHTRRACAVFEGAGFEVRCVASKEMEAVTRRPNSPRDRLAAFRDYLYERLGTVEYVHRGWIKAG